MPPLSLKTLTVHINMISKAEMAQLIETGRRATWPKIEMIRVQSKIGRTLHEIHSRYYDEIVRRDTKVRKRRAKAKKA